MSAFTSTGNSMKSAERQSCGRSSHSPLPGEKVFALMIDSLKNAAFLNVLGQLTAMRLDIDPEQSRSLFDSLSSRIRASRDTMQ